MKKFIVFILCLMLTGCSTVVQNVNSNLFDIEKAKESAGEYMSALSKGEIGTAETLCENKKISNEEVEKLKNNKFRAYKIDEINEGADYAYIKYLVIRGNNTEVRADLDSIELKVSKIDGEYKITEIEAKNIKQVYLDKENLRIIDGEIGKSDLLLRKKDLPKEVYSKGDEVTLTMDTVPDVQFSKLNVGFQGKYVGVTLSNGDKTLVSLSIINDVDNSLKKSKGASASSNTNENIEDIFEKPIAEKIVGYDLIDAGTTEKILFTNNDEFLVLQVNKEGKGSSIRIYKNPLGELVNFEIDKKFPPDKYSLDIQKITEGGIYIEVTPISSEAAEKGLYIIDIKNMDISKDE